MMIIFDLSLLNWAGGGGDAKGETVHTGDSLSLSLSLSGGSKMADLY